MGWLAFALIAGSGGLWFLRAHRVDLPEDRRGFVAVWAVGVLLAIAALAGSGGLAAGLPAVLALIGGGFLLFTVAVSRQELGDEAVRVGGRVPAFQATDDRGESFDSQSLAGSPALLKFFRGHW